MPVFYTCDQTRYIVKIILLKYSFLGIMAYVMNILYIKMLNKHICEFLS